MRRGAFACLAVLAASLAGCGDDGKPDRTIAFVRTSEIPADSQDAFLDELAEAGWRVGDNLTVLNEDPEVVFTDEAALAEAVERFVEDGADVLVALSTAAAAAAMDTDEEVPVIVVANDPVASGLLEDPRAPEGVVTGISFRVPADRTIDLARQLVGAEPAVGLLYPGDDPSAGPVVEDMAAAAGSLGVRLVDEGFVGADEVDGAVAQLADAGVGTIILTNAPATVRAHPTIEQATRAAGIPVIANTNVNAFAVLVLAPDNLAVYRQLGRQVARLLGGADVREVPLEEPGRFNLVVRTAVAEELGLELPSELLRQADVVNG